MTPGHVSQASLYSSLAASVVAWMDAIVTLPNMVMIVAIVVPIATFVSAQYWRWVERQDRLSGVETRTGADRRNG